MGVYGRNFWFLSPPETEQRLGRYVTGGSAVLIGMPVEAGTTQDANGMRTVTLRTTQVAPVKTTHGILIYENPFDTAPGFDPVLFGFGDFDHAPAGAPVQLVAGRDIRFRLKNTVDENVQGQRLVPGRTVLGGFGATPTVAVGDYIGPGPGDDVNGYWQETDLAHAWAVCDRVYHDSGEADFQMVF